MLSAFILKYTSELSGFCQQALESPVSLIKIRRSDLSYLDHEEILPITLLEFIVTSYQHDPLNALQAKTEAQKLAFAPIVFHTARTLRDLGILAALDAAGKQA
ncbi:biotin synthesis protein bioC [Photobacterium aphoticum]|uniref:Biotin synthesis protein bioC n=1 Tax=Photobacterium aphoticum TaxID=754436 RepID=A0A090R485_9GAMM|nr:biotin synthesis protein bioC [Photobacterium aphoticum]